MRTEYLCPKCGAEDTASFPSIFAAGTKAVSMGGIGIAGDGDIGLAGGVGRSQTALAASTSPPQKKGAFGGILLLSVSAVLVLLALVEVTGSGNINWGMAGFQAVMGVGFIAAAVYVLRAGSQFNRAEYPILYAAWNKRWLCRRCGKVFVPELMEAAVPVTTEAASEGTQQVYSASGPSHATGYVICNMCGAKLRPPDKGGRFKCPKCQALVIA